MNKVSNYTAIKDEGNKMDHFYQNIFGWWDEKDEAFYREAVNEFPSGSHFVEVGSFKGRSSACMAVEIINSDKDIKFDCVDTWAGSEEHREGGHSEDKDVLNGDLFDVFKKNIEPVSNIINPIKSSSVEASKQHEDESLDFVFIDGSHDFINVIKDIVHWIPKVKPGGTIAGHDYAHDGVNLAVDFYFNKIEKATLKTTSSRWLTTKNFEVPTTEITEEINDMKRFDLFKRLGILPFTYVPGVSLVLNISPFGYYASLPRGYLGVAYNDVGA